MVYYYSCCYCMCYDYSYFCYLVTSYSPQVFIAAFSFIGALGSNQHLHGMAFGDDIASGETIMNLHMLNGTEQSGAVCLDGTPGGFYFSAATNAANKDDWQIYFQGGGWFVYSLD